MRTSQFLPIAFLIVLAAAAPLRAADARVGLVERFDTMDGWRKLDFPGEEAPLKEMKSVDGVGVFVTHPAPLRGRRQAKWSDGLPMHDCFSNVVKTYPKLDLDRYRYLVVKLDEKGSPASVILNGVDLPVAYTTGVHAVDLSLYEKLRGAQPIEFRLQFLNTGWRVRIDEFRFVSQLTPEERKGLIPAGIVLRPEGLADNTTQGLDAVIRRVGRPRRETLPAERLCFRDTATGAVIWRLTGLQSGASTVSDSARSLYNASGTHMLIPGAPGGPQLWDLHARTFTTIPFAGVSRFSTTDPDILWCVEKTRRPTGLRFHRLNVRTGLDEIAAAIEFDPKQYRVSITEMGFSSGTDMIAVGLRETPHVFVFDPRVADLSRRIRHLELPMRLKGMAISPDGKRIFFNRCYWYETWQMDLATGRVSRAMRFGGSHAGSGGGLRLGHDSGLILAAPEGVVGSAAGDQVRILLNYRSGWHTDYGHLSRNRLWYVANGGGGDMAGRIVMAGTRDPGAVLQVALQNTSRNSWANNTVVKSSPDYTKLVWTSDIWGYNAVCAAYTRRPAPPERVSAARDATGVTVTWIRSSLTGDPGRRAPAEVRGYHVYRSLDGGPFLAATHRPVRGFRYRDEALEPKATARYVVAAVEHSGLEGTPSLEVAAAPPGSTPTAALHVEAEQCLLYPAAREAFNGYAGSWRYVRIRKQLETERGGIIVKDVTPQLGGAYVLWLRARTEGEGGQWKVTLGRDVIGQAAVTGRAWQWIRLEKPLKLVAKTRSRIRLASADDGLCLDKLILTTDAGYFPSRVDDRFTVAPRPLRYLVAKQVTRSSVHLAWWNPAAEPDVDYYNVYVGRDRDFPPDQGHLIVSTKKLEALDWGLTPGAEYTYKVVAVNRRGLMSAPAAITVKTRPLKQRVLLELPIDSARLDKRLKIETRGGVKYAFRPY
ncbi:MAG: fibronectin type III domain-containing protein, partial [Planctomycetota bacterium]